MPLAQLPLSTIKLIGSSQVITSVSSVVKELMENSIDSGARHIEIKLDKHGFEKIEVKDDGCGIGKTDAMVMCLPSHTSKISDFSDLYNLSSYGFRGEALSALCNVAEVSVTTKTDEDEFATCYTYDKNGQIISSKISHISKGTIVTVTNLFKNLPVRKQFMSNSKKAAEELKKVEKIVKSLAMIHPRLRVTLVHNKFLIWQKTSVTNLRQSVMQVIALSMVKQLHHILHNIQQMRVEMLVPKRDCDVSSLSFSSFTDAFYLFINNRPIRHKEIERTVYNMVFEFFGVYVPANKYPVCVLCLTLPADSLDVNLEPNKTIVLMKNQEDVLEIVKQCLHLYYGDQNKETKEENTEERIPKKRKIDGESVTLDPKKIILQGDCEAGSSGESEATGEIAGQNMEPGSQTEGLKDSDVSENSEAEKDVQIYNNDVSQEDMDNVFEDFCLNWEENLKEVGNKSENGTEEYKIVRLEENPAIPGMENPAAPGLENPAVPGLGNLVASDNPKYSSFFNCSGKENTSKELTNDNLATRDIKSDNNSKHSCMREVQSDLIGFIKKRKNEASNSVSKENKNIADIFPVTNGSKHLSEQKHNEQNDDDDDDVLIVPEQKKPILYCSNNLQKDNIEITSPSLSQWSRGELTNASGSLVEGPSVLTDNPGAASPHNSQEFTNRSVSSQMGCKEMSAFTKFARDMRKKIIEEQPQTSFTKVAQLLQTKWRQLDVEKKKKYEETDVLKKPLNSSPAQKQKSTLLTFLTKERVDIEVEVDMNRLKHMVTRSVEVEENDACLIGRLESSPLWIYCVRNCDVTVVSAERLLEAVKFHQHMANYALPVKLLNPFIKISSSDMEDHEWKLLQALERSPNGVIKDPRLVKNGFLVEIIEGEAEVRLTYVPQNISYCGTEELKEVLRFLQDYGLEVSLSKCRPLKVISFIRSEVMRECSKEEPPSQPEQVTELLSYWLNNVVPESESCIHYRPVQRSLGSFELLPVL